MRAWAWLCGGMSRKPFAVLGILVFVVGWIAGAMLLGDWVRPLPWGVQAVYYPVAGFAWVFPVRWMMLWSVHQR